jgi:hypothetical protein
VPSAWWFSDGIRSWGYHPGPRAMGAALAAVVVNQLQSPHSAAVVKAAERVAIGNGQLGTCQCLALSCNQQHPLTTGTSTPIPAPVPPTASQLVRTRTRAAEPLSVFSRARGFNGAADGWWLMDMDNIQRRLPADRGQGDGLRLPLVGLAMHWQLRPLLAPGGWRRPPFCSLVESSS